MVGMEKMETVTNVNERIAREVMGWEVRHTVRGFQTAGDPPQCDFLYYKVFGGVSDWLSIPDFAHSLDACAIAETEIERLGLTNAYMFRLLERVKFSHKSSDLDLSLWRLARATPAQRCDAMLKTVEK